MSNRTESTWFCLMALWVWSVWLGEAYAWLCQKRWANPQQKPSRALSWRKKTQTSNPRHYWFDKKRCFFIIFICDPKARPASLNSVAEPSDYWQANCRVLGSFSIQTTLNKGVSMSMYICTYMYIMRVFLFQCLYWERAELFS